TFSVEVSYAGNADYGPVASTAFDFTISPKSLTAAGSAADKVYDGTTAATVTVNLTGIVSGDSVNAAAAGTFDNKNVGANKTVTIGAVTLSGADSGNYTVGAAPDTTADITPAPLAVAADATSKVVGAADPDLTFSATGFVGGETSATALTGELSRQAGESIGSYDILQGTLAAINGNYAIAYNGAVFEIVAGSGIEISIIHSPTRIEGGSGSVKATFTVGLSAPSASTVRVDYATVEGTAEDETGNGDFSSISGTLIFAPGIQFRTISVDVAGDGVSEPDETFQVVLSNPVGATLGSSAAGEAKIINDDGGAFQIISAAQNRIIADVNAPVLIDVTYDSVPRSDTTGLALRLHFDSSQLSFNGLSSVHSLGVQPSQIQDDTADLDSDPSTDKFVLVVWATATDQWPTLGGLIGSLPLSLYQASFTTSGTFSGVTAVNFTADGPPAFDPITEPTIVASPSPISLDVDGNGSGETFSDGILVLRYLAGLTGNALVDGALENNANRTDPQEIQDFLSSAVDTMLDVDDNGEAGTFSDGILILRFLAGLTGSALIDGALETNAQRTDAAEIHSFLSGYLPSSTSGLTTGGFLTAVNSGEDFVSTTVLNDMETLRASSEAEPELLANHRSFDLLPNTQIVRATASDPTVEADQQFTVDVVYDISPRQDTSGLTLRLHYDSSELTFGGLSATHPLGVQPTQIQDDTSDLDSDPTTDKMVLVVWATASAQWPTLGGLLGSLPLSLYQAQFTAASSFTSSTINFTAQTVPGFTFDGESLTVGAQTSPMVSLSTLNREYNGVAFAPTATADDGLGGLPADLDQGNFSYTYYAGPGLTGSVISAPKNVGAYSVDVAYSGNSDYAAVPTTSFDFEITPFALTA
ncbi:MAG: hypothetical protein KDA89_22630, partial [Planctomycetaceae bacterium]|nr:hypothetical protein [Planctomycetaceae bacterium]